MPNKNKPKFTSDETLQKEHIRTVSQGVNYKTGEGMRTSFDSWEDMNQYFDQLAAEDYDNEMGFRK